MQMIAFLADISYLLKSLSNHKATLSPENLENVNNFPG